MCGEVINEYVGLRAKMYSITWPGGNTRTSKGINKSVNKKVLTHDMYKASLENSESRTDKMSRIGSRCHELYTFNVSKISLSPIDVKRFVLEDKINTLAYGHYKITNKLVK